MCFEPLPEGCGIDLDDGGFREGVGADKLVVGRVEGHADDADFAGHAFRTPGEIAGVEAEGAEFVGAAADADHVNALVADTGVGWLAALLESSGSEE